jgi:hypothetical protein
MTLNAPTLRDTAETRPVCDTETSQPSARTLLRNRDFRLLWIGETISLLGDQFYLIALPWLVLQLTGDAFAMGTVMALGGIPRAAFMLLGGALTDRFTPRLIMLASNLVRFVLMVVLAILVLTNAIALWMLYALALVFGLADAFFFPAQNTIVPRLVDKVLLQPANAIMQGTAQLSLFAGPVLAGLLIALLGSGEAANTAETVANTAGIGFAFAIDALTFIVSALTLALMQHRNPATTSHEVAGEEDADSVWQSIRAGLRHVWQDRTVRLVFMLIGAANFLINGPIAVGIPVLADTRLPEGAAAFGILMSMFGGGFLLGLILAGTLPPPSRDRFGVILGVVWSLMGVGVALLGLATSTAVAAAIILGAGAANGYVSILFMTWLQTRTPDAMLGRMMSVFMFMSSGLFPIALALSGAVIKLSVRVLFVGGGAGMTGLVLWVIVASPTLRAMGRAPVQVSEAAAMD